MKRYNFDTDPVMASGFAVHAETKKAAWNAAYRLAKEHGYNGKLVFRDNKKYQKQRFKKDDCNYCYPRNK